ncbi:MAG: polysaccharide biosynthesis C-terminal domain-containing protein, partial [Ignavibacteriae bacterium]|nr:polysaccharide biosynthesis C-terminal domain-containing protein [Ignavibacteriota bacterium]
MFNTFRKVAKNSIIYGLGNLSTKLVGFILLPLYTGYITVSDYGILAITEISSTIIIAVISLRIEAALFRWYWDKDFISKQKSIFFSSLLMMILLGILFLIPLIIFSNSISILLFSSEKYVYLLQLMAISSVLQIIIELINYLMRIQEISIFYTKNSLLKLFISLILTILFIVKFERGINGIFEAQIISQIIFFIFTSKYVKQNITLKFEGNIIIEMLKFSSPLILAGLSGIIFTASDRICLNFMDSLSQVGIYSIGFKVSNTIKIFLYNSAMMAVSPVIYQFIDKPGNKRFYSKLLTYFTFFIMVFVIFFSLFAKDIIYLFAQNESYYDAWKVIPFLTFAILFGVMKDVSITGLNITKKTGLIAIVIFIMSLLNIGLNIYFIPIYSSQGASLATLITSIISFAIFYNISQKYYWIPYELKKVFLVLIIGFAIIMISLFLIN